MFTQREPIESASSSSTSIPPRRFPVFEHGNENATSADSTGRRSFHANRSPPLRSSSTRPRFSLRVLDRSNPASIAISIDHDGPTCCARYGRFHPPAKAPCAINVRRNRRRAALFTGATTLSRSHAGRPSSPSPMPIAISAEMQPLVSLGESDRMPAEPAYAERRFETVHIIVCVAVPARPSVTRRP